MIHVPPDSTHPIALRVNGRSHELEVSPRWLLSDVIRHRLGLTGVHVGCEHGVCGACTVLLDGEPVRSCTLLAISVDGADLRTIEGFADDPAMGRLREAFARAGAVQCGFCTPGMLVSAVVLTGSAGELSDDDVRAQLTGQLCRCTGYAAIVAAVRAAVGDPTRADGQA